MRSSRAFDKSLKALGDNLNVHSSDESRLRDILERATRVANAERGFVLMSPTSKAERGSGSLADGGDEMRVVASHGLDAATLWTTAEVSLTLIRQVMKDGRAVVSDNATIDPRFSETTSVIISGLRSVLCVPIKSGRKTTALLYLDNRLHIGMFTRAQLDAIQKIVRKPSSAKTAAASRKKAAAPARNAAKAKNAAPAKPVNVRR